MHPRSVPRLLALLLWLGAPLGAQAQEPSPPRTSRSLTDEESRELVEQRRKQEELDQKEMEEEEKAQLESLLGKIRARFAKLQEASKGPASLDRSNKAKRAPWYRLRSWEIPADDEPDVTLRKLVVNSLDGSGELERDFFIARDPGNTRSRLFFAYYVTTSGSGEERTTTEERLYFDDEGFPVRWQHGKELQPRDGHALRWGEQARSDSKVARALADETDAKARFVPITCVLDAAECTGDPLQHHCPVDYALFPPPGLPVQKSICMAYDWYADRRQSCEFTQKGRVLIVTETYDEACDGRCSPHGTETTKISLPPEMGRVVQCPSRQD